MKAQIYLDYAATTPLDPRVLSAMTPFFTNKFSNTMSIYRSGVAVSERVEKARTYIASVINAKPSEIYFTSSATESNNLAIKGVAYASTPAGKNHIIISAVEHDCVLESARYLIQLGFKVSYLPVDEYGFANIDVLKKTINEKTILVSVIHGNNEIGTLNDIDKIGKICRDNNIYFHTDASQSFGRESIDVTAMNIDLLTASSHKMYGPKGAAILYVRNGVKITPIIHGGGQESGMRSSTVNVPAIIGFAKAVDLMIKQSVKENKRLIKLRDYFIEEILTKVKGTHLNGHKTKRLSNNANISFNCVEGESLLMELDFQGVSVSTGSACSSRTLTPSHVLTAIGLPPQEAHGSLRFSLGRYTTKKEIDLTIKIIMKTVSKLSKFSPFYKSE